MEQKSKDRVVVVSGGFDPVHVGHVQMFKAAKELVGPRGKVVVVINCDAWLKRKKGTAFMDQGERAEIITSFSSVDEVYIHESDDDHICQALRIIRPDIFGNGGDRRNSQDIPEAVVCE